MKATQMRILRRLPIFSRYFDRLAFSREMAALNKRFEKQDELYDSIDREDDNYIDVVFIPVNVCEVEGSIEGLVKSDNKTVGEFVYLALEGKLVFRDLNSRELKGSEPAEDVEPLPFDFVVLDGWYSHDCEGSAGVGVIQKDNGSEIADFAFCFRCRELQIKESGTLVSN